MHYNIFKKKCDLSKMGNLDYKLDRTAFQALTFAEADKQINSLKETPFEERIKQFNYLMSVAYRFVGEQWLRIDKTHFEKMKRL